MVMPACGTFRYVGVLQGTPLRVDRMRSLDRAEADAHAPDRLSGHRLVGLEPSLEVALSELVIRTGIATRAEVTAAAVPVDAGVLEALQANDTIHVVRTGTANIGLSALRGGELVVAVGAVTCVPLGSSVTAVGSPPVRSWPQSREDAETARLNAYVDVSINGELARVHPREASRLGSYVVYAVRCFELGIPGSYESLAITDARLCDPEAARRAAEVLSGGNAGLRLLEKGPR